MSAIRVKTGDKEPIEVLILDGSGGFLTGLIDIKARIRRTSDDLFFDWLDNTFKASPAQLLQVLDEVDAVNEPGRYKLDAGLHTNGFNTAVITNPTSGGDTYVFMVIQDGGTSAKNVPLTGEMTVGQYVDNLDAMISSRAVPGDAMTLTLAERTAVGVAVRDTPLSGSAAGSIGQALRLLVGIAGKSNTRMDLFVYDANGFLTSARLRVFPDAATATASTVGGSAEGEILTVTLTGLPNGTFVTMPNTVLGLSA